MFGYVVANREELVPRDLQTYQACYCGLCRMLKKYYGQAGRITLTYDMTFLILLLTSLYEPECTEGSGRCIVHPVRPRTFWQNRFTRYAADMNVVLAYYNCMDDWQDDRNILSLSEAKFLEKKVRMLEKEYPRQCGAIVRGLSELSQIEKAAATGPDAGANCFGDLMGELFVFTEDNWSGSLRRTGAALGRFIYMMDAWTDVEDDIKKNRYNPLLPMYGDADFEEQCKGILTMYIGECAGEFEKLPLVQDIEILRNILYSGVWTKYAITQKKAEQRKKS
jgi:hypothetical protein